ncbi:hypothetical protein HPP92_003393 [Vanilla planifolia]|uniref:Uncharacterized protein n=1 Tax=Vanilla planifolia TaxID=51239 RepID=A0A835VNL2_VANPL|nr:hypothetical protein HPP92_003393 [Vanilla planifolia]
MNKKDSGAAPSHTAPEPGTSRPPNLEQGAGTALPPPVPVITENQRLILLGLSEKTLVAIDIITDLLRIYRRVEEIVGPSAEMAEAIADATLCLERHRKTCIYLHSLTSGKVPAVDDYHDKDAAGPAPPS